MAAVAISRVPGRELVPAVDRQLVTVALGGMTFGIPVLSVRDVLPVMSIAWVPLAPREVAGSLNLRGRIVTAIDLAMRLGVEAQLETAKRMGVVVDTGGDLYSLLVDSVGDVLTPHADSFERTPHTLDARLRSYAEGVYRLDGALLVVLDIVRVLDFSKSG